MATYNYRESICDDIRDYINERNIVITESNKDEKYQELYDNMFICDNVTGNASGSYTFNAWQAEEYLCHNLDLLADALAEFGCSISDILKKGAESCDVTIRCYLLGECLSEVIDEFVIEDEEEEEEI